MEQNESNLLVTEKSNDSTPLSEISNNGLYQNVLRRHIKEDPKQRMLDVHRLWMKTVQHEYPMPYVPYKIGVYIRYYNQTNHENYIEKHIEQFRDDIGLCKNWTLVDFYIDKGMTAPRMENSKEWCRLLGDCFSGRVNLIVTQKVRSVSNNYEEMAFIARILATQKPPVGIYFISEDIFTLASYYRRMTDRNMLPYGWEALPKDELDEPLQYSDNENVLSETSEQEKIQPPDGSEVKP